MKAPIRLPKTDLERHQFKVGEKTETAAYIKKHVTWIRPVAAGYLDGDIFGVTMGIALPWDTDYAFLYALQNGTWVLLDEQNCGRFGVCRFGALNGRRSDVWSWKQERRVWHPSHALNRYVVNRQVVRDADGSPESGTLTFDINGQTSILTFFLDRGPDSGATLTFGITLQAGSRPVEELLGQCETSLADKYLLFNKFWGGLRLIDLETGESVLGELKLATWIN